MDGRTQHDGYFLMPCDHGMGTVMVLQGPWRTAFGREFERHGAAVLRLNPSMGWEGDDISFVRDVPGLVGLQVYFSDVLDLRPAMELPLRLLGFDFAAGRTDLPLAELRDSLEVLLISWDRGMTGLEDLPALRYLNIDRLPWLDFRSVRWPALERLVVASPKLESLAGLEDSRHLDRLEANGCIRLGDLTALETLENLKMVLLDRCRSIDDVGSIADSPSIEIFRLDSCGDIETLAPLARSSSIRRLGLDGSTNVLDGDFSFALEMKSLEFIVIRNRKHYSHRSRELNALIQER